MKVKKDVINNMLQKMYITFNTDDMQGEQPFHNSDLCNNREET